MGRRKDARRLQRQLEFITKPLTMLSLLPRELIYYVLAPYILGNRAIVGSIQSVWIVAVAGEAFIRGMKIDNNVKRVVEGSLFILYQRSDRSIRYHTITDLVMQVCSGVRPVWLLSNLDEFMEFDNGSLVTYVVTPADGYMETARYSTLPVLPHWQFDPETDEPIAYNILKLAVLRGKTVAILSEHATVYIYLEARPTFIRYNFFMRKFVAMMPWGAVTNYEYSMN